MLTDYYQITMAYAHWKNGTDHQNARFQMFYRRPPFGRQDIITCGLESAIEFVRNFSFSVQDLTYLEQLNFFDSEFLDMLSKLRFTGDLSAILEGRRAEPLKPLLQIEAPIIQCQILETPLLNIINFQSLIATKADQICKAALGDEVLEFGLRRAQGFNGAVSASRAAYIGGCHATSNLEAAIQFGIPARGTMSHAWVMSHASESEAFEAYKNACPESCIVAVDTYDTLTGVRNAIKLGQSLKGIRLDSGDLDYLSRQARALLDEANLQQAFIIASGDLDETQISILKQKGAPINAWGVGTKLVTAYQEPALTGVYKLAAIQNPDRTWRTCRKISNDAFKSTQPGLLPEKNHPLSPIFVAGNSVYNSPPIHEIRAYVHHTARS